MLAWPMISCSILGGYPAWIIKRGSRVPEIVNAEPGTYACLDSGWQEHFSPPVGQAEKMAALRGEYKLVGVLVRR